MALIDDLKVEDEGGDDEVWSLADDPEDEAPFGWPDDQSERI